MRGQPVNLPVPLKGLVANVPPHVVPQDAMLDGQNVWVDIDGVLRSRFGYQPYLNPPSLGPVIGLAWWLDIDGSNHYIAVTPTDVAAVIAGGWQKITGPTPLTGSINDPVRIRAYFQDNIINMVICNNHDPLQFWNTSLGTIQPLTPTLPAGSGNVLTANPVPALTAYIQGEQFFITVTGTNTGNVTLRLNGLAFQPLLMFSNGALVQLPPGTLVPGTIYNVSWDGTEFVIGTNLQAPIARDFAVLAGRLLAINIPTGGNRQVMQASWTAAFDFQNWPALAFQNLVDTDDTLVSIQPIGNFAAVIYGRQSAWLVQAVPGTLDPGAFQFTPIQAVTVGPCSNTAVVVAEGLHYYVGIDGSVWMCDGSGAYKISQAIDPVVAKDIDFTNATQIHGVYYPQFRHVWWWYPSRALGSTSGPMKAIVLNLERNVFEPPQLFAADGIRASTLQGMAESVTCDQITRACNLIPISCSTFGVENQLSVFLGSDAGTVHSFDPNAPNDNGNSIAYFMVPALLNAGPGMDLLLDSIDLFIDPAPAFELSDLSFFDLPFPFAQPSVPYFEFPFDLSDPSTCQLPKAWPQMNTYRRYLKLRFEGNSWVRGFGFGGGTIFLQTQQRASANLNKAASS